VLVVVLVVFMAVIVALDDDDDVASPSSRQPAAGAGQRPTLADHWHAAYGIYVCDGWLAPLTDVGPDETGIHTHTDGIAHIHPFSARYTGANATWEVFGRTAGLSFGDGAIGIDEVGRTFVDGDDCDGEPASWHLVRYQPDNSSEPVEVITGDLGNTRFEANRQAFTLAFVPDSVDPVSLGMPESVPFLDRLSDVPN